MPPFLVSKVYAETMLGSARDCLSYDGHAICLSRVMGMVPAIRTGLIERPFMNCWVDLK